MRFDGFLFAIAGPKLGVPVVSNTVKLFFQHQEKSGARVAQGQGAPRQHQHRMIIHHITLTLGFLHPLFLYLLLTDKNFRRFQLAASYLQTQSYIFPLIDFAASLFFFTITSCINEICTHTR
jgi:hypothetical protein